jgi:predicted nucleic acid-binding protein
MIVLDTNIFTFILNPDSNPSIDPKTNAPVAHARDRVELFINETVKEKRKILLPTPVLAETLIGVSSDINDFVSSIKKFNVFKIADFCERSAIELRMLYNGLGEQKLTDLRKSRSKSGIKFDLQILSIARTQGADEIVTDDSNLRKLSAQLGMKTRGLADLHLPPEPRIPGL